MKEKEGLKDALPTPPPPPPRRKSIDEKSVGTASVDWEPAISRTVSQFSIPKDLTSGRAKIQRELKPVGLYHTHRQRLTKVAYITLTILIGIFLLNAVVVSLALWRCSKLRPEDVVIEKLEVYDLEKNIARADLVVNLPERWYYSLFNVILHDHTIINLYAPEAVRNNDEAKWSPVAVIKIPRLMFGRGGAAIHLKGLPIEYGKVPLSDLLEYFLLDPNASKQARRVSVRVEFEVETTSYWIPIRFSHAIDQSIELAKVTAKPDQKWPVLDSIEFPSEQSGDDQLSIMFHIDYPLEDIPEFLSIKIPDLFIDIAYFVDQKFTALSSNCIGLVKILPHVITGDPKRASNLVVKGQLFEARRENLATLLAKTREGDFSWSLMGGIAPESRLAPSRSFLQQWISSVTYDMHIEDIARLIGFPLYRFQRRAILDTPALKLGLVEIDVKQEIPRAVVRAAVDRDYIRSLIGGSDLPKIIGEIPKIALKAMIDRNNDGSQEAFSIDLVHLPDPIKLKLNMYFGIVDISTVVQAVHQLAHSKAVDNGSTFDSMYLHISGDRLLDKLLRVFEIQLNLPPVAGGISFRHGSHRPIKFVSDSDQDQEQEQIPLSNVMRHNVKLDVTSDTQAVRAMGSIQLHSSSVIDAPYVFIYWNAMNFSVYPHDAKELKHVELLHASLKKGSSHLSLTSLPLWERFSNGEMEFDFSIRHTDEVIDGLPALILAWRHIATQYLRPETFPRVQVSGRIGSRRMDFPSCFPSRAQMFMAKTDVPRWVSDVIRTRVKIAGFTDAILHALLELPSFGECSRDTLDNHRVSVGIKVALPAVHANGCLYPTVKGREQISCIATIGLHPLIIGVELLDGHFCDITTRLAHPNERVHIPKDISNETAFNVGGNDNNSNSNPRGNRPRDAKQSPPPELFLGNEESTLINYLPISAAITDFKLALLSADKLAGAKKLSRIKTSLGYTNRKALLATDTSLLDRLLNGIGQALPFDLPLDSEKRRPSRPPVTRFYKEKPLKVQVDIKSKKRNTLKGQISIRLPHKVLPTTPKVLKSAKQDSLALLLAVQWGKTLFSLKHGSSWIKAKVSQGQVTFRLDEHRVRLNRHYGVPFTPKLFIEFAIHARAEDFSTATMRRIMGRLYDFAKKRSNDKTSKQILRQIPKTMIDFAIHTMPFDNGNDKNAPARMIKRHGHALRQQLQVSTIVEVGQRLWRHVGRSKGPKIDYQMVIKPRVYPGKRTIKLPCFLPTICSAKELKKSIPQDKLIYADISLINVIQPLMNVASMALGMMMERLNFQMHPKYLALSVRISELNLALAINDDDIIQLGIDPIRINRIGKLAYSQQQKKFNHHSSKKSNKINDVQVVVAHVKLAKGLPAIGNLLRPIKLDAAISINIDPVPKFKKHGRSAYVHYSPMNVSFSTENVHKASLLSSLVAIGMPETPVSPIFSSLKKGGAKINLLKTSKEHMEMKISNVNLLNPIPFAAIELDFPIGLSYIYKGLEFARVRVGKLMLVPGNNPLKAHVTVSKSAFGKLKTKRHFIPEFSEFLSGIALNQPLDVTAVIHLTRKFKLVSNLSFPMGNPSAGAYNPKNSGPDLRDFHEILSVGRKLPQAAWYAAKNVGKRVKQSVWDHWSRARNWFGGWYGWARQKLGGTKITDPNLMISKGRHAFKKRTKVNEKVKTFTKRSIIDDNDDGDDDDDGDDSDEIKRKRNLDNARMLIYGDASNLPTLRVHVRDQETKEVIPPVNNPTPSSNETNSSQTSTTGIKGYVSRAYNWVADRFKSKDPATTTTPTPPPPQSNKRSSTRRNERSKKLKSSKSIKRDESNRHRPQYRASKKTNKKRDQLDRKKSKKLSRSESEKERKSSDEWVQAQKKKSLSFERQSIKSKWKSASFTKGKNVSIEFSSSLTVSSDSNSLFSSPSLSSSSSSSSLSSSSSSETLSSNMFGKNRKKLNKKREKAILDDSDDTVPCHATKEELLKELMAGEKPRKSLKPTKPVTVDKKFDKKNPNGKPRIPKRWRRNLKLVKPAYKLYRKEQCRELKYLSSSSSFSTSDSEDFDRRKDKKKLKRRLKDNGKRLDKLLFLARKDGLSSSEDLKPFEIIKIDPEKAKWRTVEQDEEREQNESNGSVFTFNVNEGLRPVNRQPNNNNNNQKEKETTKVKKGKKKHHKRGLSEDEGEMSILSSSNSISISDSLPSHSRSRSQSQSQSRSRSQSQSQSFSSSVSEQKAQVKTWTELYREAKDFYGNASKRILDNYKKAYWHLALRNEQEFTVMIVGMILNLEVPDLEGRFYGAASKALQAVVGKNKGKASIRVLLAPKPCQKDGLGNAEFIDCLTKNVRKAPAILPPKYEMTAAEAPKAIATLLNLRAVPQFLDQMVFRDGMCPTVKPSLVSVALARPGAPKTEDPFLMHLMITMPDQMQETTPFSDPCHLSTKCIPRRVSNLNADKRSTKEMTIRALDGINDSDRFAVHRIWTGIQIPSQVNLLITFKFRLTYITHTLGRRGGRGNVEKAGWALVFTTTANSSKLSRRSDYGCIGMKKSIALVFDPISKSLQIHRNGLSAPLFAKSASPFPPELSNNVWYKVLAQYRPHEKLLATAISRVSEPEHQFLSLFPVDIPTELGSDHKMKIGLTSATAGYAVNDFKDVNIDAVLPTFNNTRIYYLGRQSVVPHQNGRFLLELRDECQKILPWIPFKIKVRLVPVKNRHCRRHVDPESSISTLPETRSVKCKVKAYPKFGVYLIKYRPFIAGMYNVKVAFDGRPKNVNGIDDDDNGASMEKWHRVPHYQIYVRNFW